MWLDHTLPLIALLMETSMVCTPIIRRHFFVVIGGALFYIMILLGYSINNAAPYPWLRFDSFTDAIIPVVVTLSGLAIYFILEFLLKFKMRVIGGLQNKKIIKILAIHPKI